MRRIIGLLLILGLFCGTMTFAKEKKQSESTITQIEKSEKKWLELKKKSKGNYSYKKRYSSWLGFGNETTIVVTNNKVTERHYREWKTSEAAEFSPMAPNEKTNVTELEGEKWVETGDQIGSHKKGAKALTLDERYQEAKVIAQKTLSPHEEMVVGFDKEGLLNSCFYVNTMIMDDAPQTGVNISNITLDNP